MHRTPPTGSGLMSGRADSYPNLANMPHSSDTSQITFRSKRKYENDDEELKSEVSEMRKQMSDMQKQMSDMISLLTSTNSSQVERYEKISDDISDIKNQVTEIKSTTEILIKEQLKIKEDLEKLKKLNDFAEKKIETLEEKFRAGNAITANPPDMANTREELMIELNERMMRGKNIVISGVPEAKSTNANERKNEDKDAIVKIISTLSVDIPEPENIFRLGKYQPTKIRPIKVCYESQKTATNILRRRKNLTQDNLKIYSDQTPQQQTYKKLVKEELERRIKNGENNIGIKYVKGIPKITEIVTSPKNPKHQKTTPDTKK